MKLTGLGLPLGAALMLGAMQEGRAEPGAPFDDPLFRRCISWMLEGSGGALIDNLCLENFAIPPPSIFSCARKVLTGFQSDADREGCALIFEEQAKRARAGAVR